MKRIIGELKVASVFLPAVLVVALVITGVNSLKIPSYSDIGKNGTEINTDANAKAKKPLIGKKKTVSAVKSVSKGPAGKLGDFKEKGNYKDGTYTGSARGFQSDITVSVTISKGKISNVQVLSQGETPSYWARAKAVVSRIKRSKTTNVDTVSGATYSSNGIINAVRSALRKAGGKSKVKPKPILPVKPKPLPKPKAGGKVYAIKNIMVTPDRKKQFKEYPLENVNIHIKKGKIIRFSKIKWGSTNSYDVGFQKRVEDEMIPKVLELNKYSKIDNVTGATCSSNAMKKAIGKALEEAKKEGNVPDQKDKKKPKKPKKPEGGNKKPKKPKKPGKPDNPNEKIFSYTVENINGAPIMVIPTDHYDFGKYALKSIGFKVKNDRIIDMFNPVWEESPKNRDYQISTFQRMKSSLVSRGTLDSIAGATCTSTAIKNAADEALRLHRSKPGQ